MKIKITGLLTVILLTTVIPSCRNEIENKNFAPANNQTDEIAGWENLRFGAFVHFNDNTFMESEFSKNTDPGKFNPRSIDFDAMMKTFREAGIKYAVLTTRHTSGFCLWDSKVTSFDVASSLYPKDVVKLFVDACKKYEIKPACIVRPIVTVSSN